MVIPLSKKKLFFRLTLSLVFVVTGAWLLVHPPPVESSSWGYVALMRTVGAAAVLFFGFSALLILRKLPEHKPGLIIDAAGINDNSSATAAGLVPWEDVQEISSAQVMTRHFILVMVKNPDTYIDRQPGRMKKRALILNHRTYGTPVCISCDGLKADFDDLLHILTESFARFHAPMNK